MTFLSKLSSVSSITSFLSPPPLSRLCKKQTDPHIRSNQNWSPTQTNSCVCVTLNQTIFIWARYKTGSVRSYNFPFLELTVHTAYSPQHFQDTANEPSLEKREIGSSRLPRRWGSTFSVLHALICPRIKCSPTPNAIWNQVLVSSKTNKWECDTHYRAQSTQVFCVATLRMWECICTTTQK